MLLGFSCKNYKTYRNEAVFSMVPKPRYTDLEDSILIKRVNNKDVKALPASVIYGPNASGKTNLIGAMDFLRHIVLTGSVQNIQNPESINPAILSPGLVPNWDTKNEPVELGVEFVSDDLLFEYTLGINIKGFSEIQSQNTVNREKLQINHKIVFLRDASGLSINIKTVHHLIEGIDEETRLNIAQSNLNPSDLFLTNGFRHLYSNSISDSVTNWFRSSLRTFVGSHRVQSYPSLSDNALYVPEDNFQNTITEFGIQQHRIGFRNDEKSSVPKKVTLLQTPGKTFSISSELVESLGTLRFIDLLPILFDAFKYGKTLVMDEFDASIHPMALKNIVNAFHNDEVNLNQAQLIFNTHNPFFLDAKYFRRDEIKFVDRDEETGASEIYQLSDFSTNGRSAARKTNSYMKNYFIHKYGAVHEVDFTQFLKKAAEEGMGAK